MTASAHPQGLLDTDILILRSWIESNQLPDEMAISAVTLAELSAGPHQVRPDTEQRSYAEHAERARRLDPSRGSRTSSIHSPSASKRHGPTARVTAAVVAAGRQPRRRTADLMIAATAIAEDLPLFTTNPADFNGLTDLLTIVPVSRPEIPHERQ